ncbi:aminoglycoside phosphotransferase [Pseudonocardia acaciae]|uniref:aminoglycoside phosphotransferase n=1 Tax=Pseudonocardia acaciae TaxID=551276 RepID=UPI0012EE589A|nr:aminoglycoside phosphotransferase [Pseudonocardia acaciae]
MTAVRWQDLPDDIRNFISRRVDGLISAEPVNAGSAEITLILTTESTGRFFLKGARGEKAGIEVKVQSYLPGIAPQLRWHANVGEYLLMAFEYIEGRSAILSPGSDDLPAIASAISDLSQTACLELPVLPAEKRWAHLADDPAALAAISGDSLVHTDLTADNFIVGEQLRIVDWAWPTKGAAWLDAASMIVRLMQAGHSPRQAEEWARTIPTFRKASDKELAIYAKIRASLARGSGVALATTWENYLAWLGT